MEGSNGTKDQVLLACKAEISSFIAECQHSKRSASLKLIGSKSEGDSTREGETDGEETVKELRLAVFGCLGRNTIECCRGSGGADGIVVEGSCGRE